MKILGLIMENNPFHNGHKYFINEAIKKVNPDYAIVLTSTNFTMRGEISIINKLDKTKILLDNNIDFVFELPVAFANQSADYFAYNAIKILNDLKITDLAFGGETNSIEELTKYAKFIETSEFNNYFQKKYIGNKSYKNSHFETYKHFFPNASDTILLPNNTLGIQYIKSVNKINKNIKLHLIDRIGDNDNNQLVNNMKYPSGTALRKLHENCQNISEYLPNFNYTLSNINNETLLNLIKYQFLIQNNLTNNSLVNEGIENLIIKNLDISKSYQDLIYLCSNKKYSSSRIRRVIISSLLNISNNISTDNSYYYRLLGFNQTKKSYLTYLKNNNIEVFSSLKTIKDPNTNRIIEIEKKAARLYDMITNTSHFKDEFILPIKN